MTTPIIASLDSAASALHTPVRTLRLIADMNTHGARISELGVQKIDFHELHKVGTAEIELFTVGVHRILQNPIYCGIIRYNDELIPSTQVARASRRTLADKIEATKAKLDRLTAAYLEQAFSLDEYRIEKNKLIDEKANLEGKLTKLRKDPGTRLEPARLLVNTLFEATLLTSAGDRREKISLLKKTGSNLTVQDQHVLVEFHEPWKTVEKYGRLAQRETGERAGRW